MGDAVATDAGGIDTVVADGGMGAGDAARAGRASSGEPLGGGGPLGASAGDGCGVTDAAMGLQCAACTARSNARP